MRTTKGLTTQAFEAAERAYRIGKEATDLESRVLSRDVMLDANLWRGNLEQALRWADETLRMVGDNTEVGLETTGAPTRTWSFARLGTVKSQMGHLDEGRRDLEVAVRLARDRGHWEVAAWSLALLVLVDQLTGEVEEALGRTQQALEFAGRVQSPFAQNVAHQCMGLAHLLRGEPREAIGLLERSHAFRLERRTALNAGPSDMADLAAACLALGDAARARTLIEEALEFGERGGAWLRGARVYLVRAQVLRESEGGAARDEIEATLARADALIGKKGARAWEPFVAEERARLAELVGDRTQAGRRLRQAHRLFIEMGATGHAERVARELEELGVSP